jgi:hypothetical protein
MNSATGRKSRAGRLHAASKRTCLVENPWRNYEANAKSSLQKICDGYCLHRTEQLMCVFMLGGEGEGPGAFKIRGKTHASGRKSMEEHAKSSLHNM